MNVLLCPKKALIVWFGSAMQTITRLVSHIVKITYFGLLLTEATVTIILAQLVIKFVPFRRYSNWLRSMNGQEIAPELFALRLKRVNKLVDRFLPWETLCLPRAISAKAMLARRGYASVLTLGVADVQGDMKAHAWLTAGDIIVSGREAMQGFHDLAHFGR
jgi:Transglutaminase-like superfamily